MTTRRERVLAVALSLVFSVAFIEFPLFSLAGLTITSTEFVIGVFLLTVIFCYGWRVWRPDRIAWGLLAVVASLLLTTAFTPTARFAAIKFTLRFGAGVALYLSLRIVLAKPQLARTALRALVIASMCFSVIGLVQHYIPKSLDPVLSLIIPNKFAVYDPSASLAFTTGILHSGRTFIVRASSVFGYCNTFSYFLVMTLGAALLLAWREDDRYWKETAIVSLPLNAWALWATFSRGAWLALIVAAVAAVGVWALLPTPRDRRRVWIAGAVLAGCAVLAMLVTVNRWHRPHPSRPAATKAASFDERDAALDSVDTRLQLWRAAVAMWRTAPVFGIGVDRFRFAYHNFLPLDNYDLFVGQGLYQPHNIFLAALSCQGLVGLLALLFCLLSIAAVLWAQRSHLGEPPLAIVVGLLAGIGAANTYDAMMFDSYPHMILIDLVLALLAAEGWRRG